MTERSTPNTPTSPIRVVWPPPGLEGSQGVFWRTAGRLGFGGSFLAFPVLFSVAFPQPFNSLGLFGSAWWILCLTSLLGLLIVMRALGGLFGFFRTARTAALRGIDLEVVLQVAADHDGEMGAVIQGTRSYRSLKEGDRARAVRARIWASILFLSAATWITAGWVLSLLLAGRGLLGPTGVWILTLGPAGLTLIAATVAKGIEGTALQGAFGRLFWSRSRNAGQRDAAEIWGDELRRFRAGRGEQVTSGRRALLAGALSVIGFTAFVVVPTASFTVVSSVGPALAAMALPSFPMTAKKAGLTEALRDLRLPFDPGITPLDAGEALQAIASAGGLPSLERIREAPRAYEKPFMPGGLENPLEIKPQDWPRGLFPVIVEGISPEGEAFLRGIADHPGLKEFDTMAYAPAIDVLGGRLQLPLPKEMSALEIPIPRFSPVREGAYALVAKAAVQFMDGDPGAAERTLRVLLSAGLLLSDDSPTLIDALIGFVLVSNAGDALEGLFEASSRPEDADALRRIRETTERATEMVQQWSSDPSVADALRGMPGKVTAEGMVRGLRWEYLHLLTGLSPCLNPHQAIFGPDEDWTQFLRSARAKLVRYPSEAALFEVMERGWFNFPTSGGWEGALLGTMKATLGGRPGSCAEVLASGIF